MNTDHPHVIRVDQQIASPSACTDLQAGSVDKSEGVCIFEGNFKNIDFYFDLRKLNAAYKEATARHQKQRHEDCSSDGPGFSGAAVHRFRHDYDWTSVCHEDLDTMLDRAVQTFIPDIKQEDYIVRPPFCLGNELYIDVEVINAAFFEDFYHFYFECNGQTMEHEQAGAQVGPGQVLLILTNLDPRVNASKVAERIKIQLTESVEITNTFSIHSEQPTRKDGNHLEFEGSIYALGRYRSIRNSVPDCLIVDLSGIEFAKNEDPIYCLTQQGV